MVKIKVNESIHNSNSYGRSSGKSTKTVNAIANLLYLYLYNTFGEINGTSMEKIKDKMFNILIGMFILAGVFVLYYIVFTKPDHEVVMNEFGDLENRDNSFILPVQRLAMILLPAIGLYYLIKSKSKKQ